MPGAAKAGKTRLFRVAIVMATCADPHRKREREEWCVSYPFALHLVFETV